MHDVQPKKLKVAMVVGLFPVLSEAFVINQIKGLMDAGHEVDILSFKKSSETQVPEDVSRYDLLRKVVYIKRVPEQKLQAVVKFLVTFFRFVLFYPREVMQVLNIKRYGNVYVMLDNFFKLSYFLGKNYDVVHCHFGPMAKQLIFLKDILPKIKIVTQFHGYDISSYVQKEGKDTYRELFQRGDYFLPVSEHFKNRLVGIGCPLDKTGLMYCGVYLDKFSFQEKKFDFREQVRLLSLGRLVEKKGVQYVIDALPRLKDRFSGVELTIVGDGDQRKNLEEQVSRLGLTHQVHFKGSVTNDEARKYFEQADIFIAPSVTSSSGDEEGLVVTIKEAMAIGVPVVSTVHAGIPEMITDGFNGFLAPERESVSLAEKLSYLILNPELCRQFASRARQTVENKFDQKIINKKLEDIYFHVYQN